MPKRTICKAIGSLRMLGSFGTANFWRLSTTQSNIQISNKHLVAKLHVYRILSSVEVSDGRQWHSIPSKTRWVLFCFGTGNAERSKLLETWKHMSHVDRFETLVFLPFHTIMHSSTEDLQRNGWPPTFQLHGTSIATSDFYSMHLQKLGWYVMRSQELKILEEDCAATREAKVS